MRITSDSSLFLWTFCGFVLSVPTFISVEVLFSPCTLSNGKHSNRTIRLKFLAILKVRTQVPCSIEWPPHGRRYPSSFQWHQCQGCRRCMVCCCDWTWLSCCNLRVCVLPVPWSAYHVATHLLHATSPIHLVSVDCFAEIRGNQVG